MHFYRKDHTEKQLIYKTRPRYESGNKCSFSRFSREADQCAIVIVESTQNQGNDERLEDGRRDEMTDAAKLTQCCKAA